jgi:hypothetical protein
LNHESTNQAVANSGFDLKKLTKSQLTNLRKLAVIHSLVTVSSPSTGNQNPYWGIPYFWHYTNPNPRDKIILIEQKLNLSVVKPPKRFARYKSYSSIDRTPDIYWADFANEKPLYRYAGIPDFYTFGWCSEREMAFLAWLHFLSISGQIVLNGNHVWSVVELEPGSGKWLKVDNTFDRFYVTVKPQKDETPLAKWYNKNATAPKIISFLKLLTLTELRKNNLSKAL